MIVLKRMKTYERPKNGSAVLAEANQIDARGIRWDAWFMGLTPAQRYFVNEMSRSGVTYGPDPDDAVVPELE